MRVSVFYDHIREAAGQTGKTERELLEELYQAGARGLEIRLEDLRKDWKLCGRLSEMGFEISCIYEFYEMGKRDETEKSRIHIETAAEAKCGRILVVPGFLEPKEAEVFHRLADQGEEEAAQEYMERNQELEQMRRGLSQMTAWGREQGVKVTVEDFDDLASPLSRILGVQWFLKNVPDLGFTFDMGNFVCMGEDIGEAWDRLRPWTCHVHCKDRRRGMEPAQAGTGEIPVGELIRKLEETGYEGWLAAEHFEAPDQEAFMLGSVRFLIKNAKQTRD